MQVDYTYAPDPYNEDGKVMLMSALKLYAEVLNKDTTKTLVPIGMANSMDVDERRNIVYNFVIGNRDPSTARDLIAGPVEESTMQVGSVVMYKANLIGLVSEDAKNPTIQGTRYVASIRSQTRPFTMIETWVNPATEQVVLTQKYLGCMIASCRKQRSMQNTDWRILEDLTIHFKTTQLEVNEAAISDPSLGNLDLTA
jgi:hypothetical protein